MIEELKTQIDFTARYYKLGRLLPETENLWFVQHGYGQLAQYFIKHFEVLQHASTCIIAPEALSKFYLSGFSGRVGATWMTKENRLTEIDNYIAYLHSIYQKELLSTLSLNPQLKTTLLGFSQGNATTIRWAMAKEVHFDRLILWAGTFPHDMDLNIAKQKLEGKEVFFVYGEQDPYINEASLEAHETIMKQLGISYQKISFKGEHRIDGPTLQQHFV